MQVLMSIDGSTTSSGVALFNMETKELIHYECVVSSSTEKIKRINKIVDRFEEIYEEYKVTTIIMEEPLPEDVKNNDVAFKALMYLQAETAIRFFNKFKKKIDEFIYVTSWRKACGIVTGRYGQREKAKAEDVAFVKNRYGLDVNDDIADAICIGWAWLNKPNDLKSTKDSSTIQRSKYKATTEKSAF